MPTTRSATRGFGPHYPQKSDMYSDKLSLSGFSHLCHSAWDGGGVRLWGGAAANVRERMRGEHLQEENIPVTGAEGTWFTLTNLSPLLTRTLADYNFTLVLSVYQPDLSLTIVIALFFLCQQMLDNSSYIFWGKANRSLDILRLEWFFVL